MHSMMPPKNYRDDGRRRRHPNPELGGDICRKAGIPRQLIEDALGENVVARVQDGCCPHAARLEAQPGEGEAYSNHQHAETEQRELAGRAGVIIRVVLLMP
jgi:hypothetical protein